MTQYTVIDDGGTVHWGFWSGASNPVEPAGPRGWWSPMSEQHGQAQVFWRLARARTTSTPSTAAVAGGGGWIRGRKKEKRRFDYISPPTREQMAERVRKQREALGILPRPAQKRIEAAVKKEVRRAEPDIAELAPVAAEVAQDSGTALQAVIDAIAATFQHQRGLVAARMEADAARRQEAEQLAAEQARAEAEAAEQAWQQRLVQLRAEDEELLRRDAEARQKAIETIRGVQKALLALIRG